MARDKTVLEKARDELFSHVNRCGVLEAGEEDQRQWMSETVEYMAERYPELSADELTKLETLGMRFCRPAIKHGAESTALTREEANAS